MASEKVSTAHSRFGAVPQLEFNYGAAPNLQLHMIVPLAFNNPAEGHRQSGLGAIELWIKCRLVQETDRRSMIGIHVGSCLIDQKVCALPHVAFDEEEVSLTLVTVIAYEVN